VHAKELKLNSPDEFERLKALSSEDADHEFYIKAHPLPPKWEFLGAEDQLAQMYGQDIETQHTVNVKK
jgi:hypothetical protein